MTRSEARLLALWIISAFLLAFLSLALTALLSR